MAMGLHQGESRYFRKIISISSEGTVHLIVHITYKEACLDYSLCRSFC